MNNPARARSHASAICRECAPFSFERRWQTLCLRGNRAFAQGENTAAERRYNEALDLAHVAMGMVRRAGEAVSDEKLERWLAVWVISHLNLSDLHVRAGQPERALEVAFAAYEKIVECLHDTRIPSRVHHACLRHMRHVLDGLMDLMKTTGIPDASAVRIFSKAQALALGYWNAWT
jgi:hypothetical protein